MMEVALWFGRGLRAAGGLIDGGGRGWLDFRFTVRKDAGG
ncbi:hypothetical protein IHE45_06G043900 [Dioscorea alata]|uniref:Uncharacterized protein n=1 Tax=Dioscorea alata TaxID=55571 RepID=A0ACB7VWX5_DIOAL|nr:hypothetical protein IHE45_06G043900 [Dioscorea alata]